MDNIENKALSDEEIMQKLLAVNEVPTVTCLLKRLGIPVTLKGLTNKQVYRLKEKCTNTVKDGHGRTERELDTADFNVALVVAATVKPNWADPKLLSKFVASSGEEVIKRLLLAGEIANLSDKVMEVSGFNTELPEVKN